MTAVRAAIYARVSSERQADAGTIASQVAALRDRVAADGLALAPTHEFLDEGHSGTTLIRPALAGGEQGAPAASPAAFWNRSNSPGRS